MRSVSFDPNKKKSTTFDPSHQGSHSALMEGDLHKIFILYIGKKQKSSKKTNSLVCILVPPHI